MHLQRIVSRVYNCRLSTSPHHQRRPQPPQQRCHRRQLAAPPAAALAGAAVPIAQLADAAEGLAAACSGLGCAQEAFDAVARPFAGLGALIPSGEPFALSVL